jgi:DNA polymerase III delta prime subunit
MSKSSASAVSDNHTITAIQAARSLKQAMKAKRPVFLWGPPGIGKSDVVQQLAVELGGSKEAMIDLRMAQMEPTDIRGIPFFNKENGKMDWAEPVDLPSEEFASKFKTVVLFLDEMNSAPPAVQAAGYQLILNRRVGKYKLPDNVVIIAAGNRDSDKGVTYRMPMPLANRFVHLEMRPDFTAWQLWAVNEGIHKDVVGYLSFAKNDMYDFDAKSSSRAFATPRSWCFVSDLLNDEDNIDSDSLFNLVAGAVGDGLAVKFMAHRKVAGKMPDPQDILEGKVKTLAVKEISAMYSLTISMCYELKDAITNKRVDNKKFHEMAYNFIQYMMDNFETELVVMGAKIALKTYQLPIEPTQLKNFDEFHKKYGKYIVDAGS